MSRLLTEQKVLKQLDIEDFRHLTKDKVITMASMLDKIDITDVRHYDYLFNCCLSLIALAIKYLV